MLVRPNVGAMVTNATNYLAAKTVTMEVEEVLSSLNSWTREIMLLKRELKSILR